MGQEELFRVLSIIITIFLLYRREQQRSEEMGQEELVRVIQLLMDKAGARMLTAHFLRNVKNFKTWKIYEYRTMD